ncbi:MAG: GNAT family N-acetyltransferase [Alphaproteobacteria bacterium]|nr:GNAT family N-acetyltransferase [Alphaproteobacteria bacterium]MBL7096907.1 GNAT family N-acetyltransferase [Alphaproteobacteria bacterium]
MAVAVEELDAKSARPAIPELAAVLADCVAGGASVGFMDGFGVANAALYFKAVFASVEEGNTILLAARDGRRIVGTVQLGLDTMPNQPHRADLKKLLVHRAARGKGVGEALMTAAEKIARREGRRLLTLDTVTESSGWRLYKRLGWTEAGIIPDYALFPDGTYCDTTIFWKRV